MGKMFETLQHEKKLKWFCLVCQKIIAMLTDSVVCERYLKWNHLSCTFLKKLPKVYIAKLNFKISKMKYMKYNLTTRCFDNKTFP